MSNTLKTLFHPVAEPFLWLHHRMLAHDETVGWIPYLWLLYLGFLFIPPFDVRNTSTAGWVSVSLAVVIFLMLYFRFYRARTPRERHWIILAITLLGLVFIVYEGNGQVFIIYAAAFCGFSSNLRKGLLMLAAILAALLVEAVIFRLTPWLWAFGLLGGVVVGIANAYFGEKQRKNLVLKKSQEEIRKLAASAERERIARDLHDLLGHTLTLIIVKAELAATLAERDLAGAAREIRDVERISREALAQVREAVGGYRGGGLIGELANARVALAAANVGLAEKVELPELTPSQDSALAMVLREAVTNIIRHSGAQHCRIELENQNRQLRLLVEDDGHGGALREGNGLRGMRERLQSAAGKLEIDSSHGGTRLAVVLPVSMPRWART